MPGVAVPDFGEESLAVAVGMGPVFWLVTGGDIETARCVGGKGPGCSGNVGSRVESIRRG
jgi:hypothetical protein